MDHYERLLYSYHCRQFYRRRSLFELHLCVFEAAGAYSKTVMNNEGADTTPRPTITSQHVKGIIVISAIYDSNALKFAPKCLPQLRALQET